ncbi:MAG: sugar ABC transporter substrate-binding protein [Lachnospiraceae bacterium]
MKLKSLTAVVMTAVCVIAMAGCGQKQQAETGSEPPAETQADHQDSGDKKLKIGVSMQGNQSGFVQYFTSAMYEYQNTKATDIDMEVMFADDDSAKQFSQIETFVSGGVDAIIIQPVDKTQSSAAVDLAADAKVPIITLNTVTDSTRNTAHVGCDDVEAGELQMERIISEYGSETKLAYVDAVLGHSAQVLRAQGYQNVLDKNPSVELVVHDTGNWSPEESMRLVENWLQAGVEVDAILCMADIQLTGVITAVENAGKIGEIKLAGMDCDPVILKAIKDGKVDCSIWQDGLAQGENALRLAIDAAQGKEVSDFIIPYEVCTKDNIDEYEQKAAERDELAKKYF